MGMGKAEIAKNVVYRLEERQIFRDGIIILPLQKCEYQKKTLIDALTVKLKKKCDDVVDAKSYLHNKNVLIVITNA